MKVLESIFQIYNKNTLKIWILFLVAGPTILISGSLFLPELFWDGFLWKYLWGPVVADAEGRSVDGISSGYNLVNTAVYAIILMISFFGIYEIFKYFEIEVNQKFVYALMPWVILGGALRSLEDMGLFKQPLDRFLITPLIYFLLGFFVLFLLVLGASLSRSGLGKEKSTMMKLIPLLPLPVIYLLFNNLLADYFVWYLIIIAIGILISFFVGLKFFDLDEKYLFFSYGLVFLLLALSYNAHYIISRSAARSTEAVLIPALGFGMTFLLLGGMWFVDRVFEEKITFKQFPLFISPLNILIIWSHFFDASATYRGIAAYGYTEKHVLPTLLIEITGTPLIMFALKLVLIFSVVYVLDVMFKKEFSEEKTLSIFLKFLIITLGAAPAVRNTLRIAMGV